MSSASTYRGESIRNALFEEIAWSKVEELTIVQLRIERSTPEGMVLATPLTQRQAVWLAERGLIHVSCCDDDLRARLREVTLYPADYAKLVDELLEIKAEFPDSGEYVRPAGKARGGMVAVTRIYEVPVVNFIPGFS